jgi:carbonic anhydrase
MHNLIEGLQRFRSGSFLDHRERLHHLAQVGQAPRTMVISCCDSRLDPQMIFAAAPGDLLVVRNIANLVPPYQPDAVHHGTSAALEFGVCRLGVEQIVILGHSQCGGVRALLTSSVDGDFIGSWMNIAAEARKVTQLCPEDEAQRVGELACIGVSLRNLMTFPWIRERVETGRLTLLGCFFDFETGNLLHRDLDSAQFVPLADAYEQPRECACHFET